MIQFVLLLSCAAACAAQSRGPRPGAGPTGVPGMPPPSKPPTRLSFLGGFADADNHCMVQTDSAEIDGLQFRMGGLLEMNELYSPLDDECRTFGNWGAVQQSLGLLYALDIAETVLPHRAIVRRILSGENAGQNILAATIFDSCASALLGVTLAQRFIAESTVFRQATLNSVIEGLGEESVALQGNCTRALEESAYGGDPLAGIIGPMSSSTVIAVSPLLSVYNIPHISYWASSTLFDDTQDYPYLFRTVPSDQFQVAAIASLVEYFNWTFVSLVAAEDDEYSGRGYELLRSEVIARQTFCLDVSERFTGRSSSLARTRLLAKRLSRSRARVIIVYAPVLAARTFLQALELEGVTDKILISSHDWINRLTIRDGTFATKIPIIGLAPRQLAMTGVRNITRQMMRDLRKPDVVARYVQIDPWFRSFVEQALQCKVQLQSDEDDCMIRQDRGPRPSESPPPTRSSRPPACRRADYARFVPPRSTVIAESLLSSVVALGLAMSNAAFGKDFSSTRLPDRIPPPGQVRQELIDMELPCSSGMCKVFTAEQSTRPSFYIQNVQMLSNNSMGRVRYDAVAVGAWSPDRGFRWYEDEEFQLLSFGKFPLAADNLSKVLAAFPTSSCRQLCHPGERRVCEQGFACCCWSCIPCDGNEFSNATNADQCETCPLGFTSDGTACFPIAPQQYAASSAEYLVSTVLSIVFLVAAIFTLIYYRIYSDSVLIRASDLELSTLTLVGMIVGFIFVPFVNIWGSVTTTKCIVSTVVPEPIKTFVISTVLVKTKRFDSVFNSMKILSRHKRRRFLLGTPMQIVAICGLTLVNVILGTLYAIINPSVAITELGLSTVVVYCEIEYLWQGLMSGYNCVLLIVCIVLAFLTRKLPDEYNQAQLIYLSSLTAFVVWLGLQPAYFVTGRELRPLISSLSLACLLEAFWVCLFLPRLIQMFRNRKYRMPRTKASAMSLGSKQSTTNSHSSLQASPLTTPNVNRKVYLHSPLVVPNEADGHSRGPTPQLAEASNLPANHQQMTYVGLNVPSARDRGSTSSTGSQQETTLVSDEGLMPADRSPSPVVRTRLHASTPDRPYTVSNV
eukprot:scpid20048/ scgid19352/ Metabotropic glutamate receptor 1